MDVFRKIRLYREKAARCEESAGQAKHPIIRASYLHAAETWRKMAEDAAKDLQPRNREAANRLIRSEVLKRSHNRSI